jgi:hypothetical protein
MRVLPGIIPSSGGSSEPGITTAIAVADLLFDRWTNKGQDEALSLCLAVSAMNAYRQQSAAEASAELRHWRCAVAGIGSESLWSSMSFHAAQQQHSEPLVLQHKTDEGQHTFIVLIHERKHVLVLEPTLAAAVVEEWPGTAMGFSASTLPHALQLKDGVRWQLYKRPASGAPEVRVILPSAAEAAAEPRETDILEPPIRNAPVPAKGGAKRKKAVAPSGPKESKPKKAKPVQDKIN